MTPVHPWSNFGTYMKQLSNLTLIILLILSFCVTAYAQQPDSSKMPSQILFNGYLTDIEGRSFSNDNCKFTVHIYDSPDSGTPVWTQTYESVVVKDGVFTLPINTNENIRFDKKYYLGIQINDEEEMPQRLELGSTAYSLGARYANTLRDGAVTTEKIKDNSVTSDKIRNLSLSKITDLPQSIGSIENLRSTYRLAGSDYEWWTLFGNLIFGPERHFIGTRNERDFLIQTHETDRMRFNPYGYIKLGTTEHPVDFEVFGLSIFDYLFITGNLGVGVDPALAKMHINAPLNKNPLRISYQNNPIFTIDKLGRVEITSTLSGSDGEINNYPLYVSGGEQGIGIDIEGNADGDNNYVSFWDDDGMAGRIEGQTAGEYASDPANIATDAFLAALVVAEVVAVAAWWPVPPVPLEPADIIRVAADIAEITFNMIWDYAHLGITYESGSGDYAEWLEKNDPAENISAGDIVGVCGGKISRVTAGADQLMAISTSPVILGNMPAKNEEAYEKAAFMGQVPVKVRGAVNYGDYIIPSGLNDGEGIAVAPELMSADELDKIVGRAWGESTLETLKMVNVLVGVSTSDLARIVNQNKSGRDIKSRAHSVEKETAELKARLEKIKSSMR